jgi:hypothetical protein
MGDAAVSQCVMWARTIFDTDELIRSLAEDEMEQGIVGGRDGTADFSLPWL